MAFSSWPVLSRYRIPLNVACDAWDAPLPQTAHQVKFPEKSAKLIIADFDDAVFPIPGYEHRCFSCGIGVNHGRPCSDCGFIVCGECRRKPPHLKAKAQYAKHAPKVFNSFPKLLDPVPAPEAKKKALESKRYVIPKLFPDLTKQHVAELQKLLAGLFFARQVPAKEPCIEVKAALITLGTAASVLRMDHFAHHANPCSITFEDAGGDGADFKSGRVVCLSCDMVVTDACPKCAQHYCLSCRQKPDHAAPDQRHQNTLRYLEEMWPELRAATTDQKEEDLPVYHIPLLIPKSSKVDKQRIAGMFDGRFASNLDTMSGMSDEEVLIYVRYDSALGRIRDKPGPLKAHLDGLNVTVIKRADNACFEHGVVKIWSCERCKGVHCSSCHAPSEHTDRICRVYADAAFGLQWMGFCHDIPEVPYKGGFNKPMFWHRVFPELRKLAYGVPSQSFYSIPLHEGTCQPQHLRAIAGMLVSGKWSNVLMVAYGLAVERIQVCSALFCSAQSDSQKFRRRNKCAPGSLFFVRLDGGPFWMAFQTWPQGQVSCRRCGLAAAYQCAICNGDFCRECKHDTRECKAAVEAAALLVKVTGKRVFSAKGRFCYNTSCPTQRPASLLCKCLKVAYCCKECAKADWHAAHAWECELNRSK